VGHLGKMKLIDFKSSIFGFKCAKEDYIRKFMHARIWRRIPDIEMVDMSLGIRSVLRGGVRRAINWE
jgi:hypothetical protein